MLRFSIVEPYDLGIYKDKLWKMATKPYGTLTHKHQAEIYLKVYVLKSGKLTEPKHIICFDYLSAKKYLKYPEDNLIPFIVNYDYDKLRTSSQLAEDRRIMLDYLSTHKYVTANELYTKGEPVYADMVVKYNDMLQYVLSNFIAEVDERWKYRRKKVRMGA